MVISGLVLALAPLTVNEYVDPADPSTFELLLHVVMYAIILCLLLAIVGGLWLFISAISTGASNNNISDKDDNRQLQQLATRLFCNKFETFKTIL